VQPIPWGGHYHAWYAQNHHFPDFTRRSNDGLLRSITVSNIDSGYGGGGVPHDNCPDGYWVPSYAYSKNYDALELLEQSGSHRMSLSNATGYASTGLSLTTVLNTANETIECFQTVDLTVESAVSVVHSNFGNEPLEVSLNVFAYEENPPPAANDELYRLSITRANGDQITINYDAIGSTLANVSYTEGSQSVSTTINTAPAPFPEIRNN